MTNYQDINAATIDRWIEDGWEWGKPIVNSLSFNPLKNPEQMKQLQDEDAGVQFSHSLEEQIGGQLEAGFAATVCSALILDCLEEGLYPSWDAQNLHSVRLAEKLGYELEGEYTVYEVKSED